MLRAAKFARQPLDSSVKPMQPNHRRRLIGRQHLLFPNRLSRRHRPVRNQQSHYALLAYPEEVSSSCGQGVSFSGRPTRWASRQRRPFRMTTIMPDSTRRSSTLRIPCESGTYGSIPAYGYPLTRSDRSWQRLLSVAAARTRPAHPRRGRQPRRPRPLRSRQRTVSRPAPHPGRQTPRPTRAQCRCPTRQIPLESCPCRHLPTPANAGKNHKQALAACARKLLTFANAVLARKTESRPQHSGC